MDKTSPPPRFLLGCSLLFWGAMTGRPVIGLIAGLLVELRHWTTLRWDFDEDAVSRAWQFTTLAIALAAVLIWLDGNRYTALPSLLSWMPPLLLPMQFIQAFGMRDSLPLSAFSFLARQRRSRNQRLGLAEDPTVFNFGNVVFATCMVAASVGSRADSPAFLPCLVLLTGWGIFGAGRSRLASLIPVLAAAGLAGFGGKVGIEYFEEWLGRSAGTARGRFDPNFSGTLIGALGLVRQSPDIVWRVRTEGNAPLPRLLRTGTFNTFIGNNWQNQRVAATDFNDLDTRIIGGKPYYLLDPRNTDGGPAATAAGEADRLPTLPSFWLRGAATEESPLPLPGDVAGLADFELDGVERNTFGTVRIYPKNPVIDGGVYWKGGTNPDFPPIASEDLRLPIAEKETIRAVVAEIGIQPTDSLQARLAALRTWFHKEFRYTRNLTIRSGFDGRPGPTAMTRFVKETRAGHCEYFATAAALILRDTGTPARYATGFALMEKDPKRGGWVIRGTHGHAWCRVWDGGSGAWIDFDPTPPDWMAGATPEFTRMQLFNDALKRIREDFFVWRNRPANRLAVSIAMSLVALALVAFISRRLWRSKRRLLGPGGPATYDGPRIRTPLHDVEIRARKLLGSRAPGQTFAGWLSGLEEKLPESPQLREAIDLHQRLRFDPAPAPDEARQRLEELSQNLASRIRNS